MGELAVPILPSRDLRETLSFYERLGFENRGADPEVWDYLSCGGNAWGRCQTQGNHRRDCSGDESRAKNHNQERYRS